MPGWSELLPFVLLGLAGAAHCAGMCGGFAVAVALAAGPARGRAVGHGLAYVVGKALTYAVLGLVVARAGDLAVHGGAELGNGAADARLSGLRAGLATVVGLGLVAAGLAHLGLGRRLWPARWRAAWARLGGAAGRLFAGVRELPGAAGALGTGVLTGLLPCGLSWSALALALTARPVTGAAGLFLFGLATAPALLLVGFGARGLPVRARALAARAVGPLLILLGLFTAARGGLPSSLSAAGAALPECCQEPSAP
jgi:hypothetical protein